MLVTQLPEITNTATLGVLLFDLRRIRKRQRKNSSQYGAEVFLKIKNSSEPPMIVVVSGKILVLRVRIRA